MKYQKAFLLLAMFLFTSSANAAYQCSGSIDNILQKYDGTIYIVSSDLYGNGAARMICNIGATWKGVTVDVCRGWLSKLLAKEAQSETITVQYADTNSLCSDQPEYTAASNPWAIW